MEKKKEEKSFVTEFTYIYSRKRYFTLNALYLRVYGGRYNYAKTRIQWFHSFFVIYYYSCDGAIVTIFRYFFLYSQRYTERFINRRKTKEKKRVEHV